MKKKEALFRAIGGVGDDLIARAEQPVSKKNTVWLRWTAMAACCALVAGIAAFAHLTFGQSKSTDSVANMKQSAMQAESFSVESSAPESAEAVEEETAIAADEAPMETEQPEEAPMEAPAVTAETAPEEDSRGFMKGALFEAPSFTFAGIQYVQAGDDGAEPQPGELLGRVEESDSEALTGCEIYACESFDPADRALLLLDGEYLLFRNAETLSPAE